MSPRSGAPPARSGPQPDLVIIVVTALSAERARPTGQAGAASVHWIPIEPPGESRSLMAITIELRPDEEQMLRECAAPAART